MISLFPQPGPTLPTFFTLLIAGPYHPSAPIHLALTQTPNARTLLLAPSRSAFKDAVVRSNDSWLHTHSGNGATSGLAANVTILYPPTPVHLSLVLSMLHVPRASSQNANLHPKTTQIVAPSLIILAEPSHYFLSTDRPMSSTSITLSSYLNLVTRVFGSLANLTSGDAVPRFALFDSQLDKFKLPLTAEPSRAPDNQIFALPLVEKLFQWVGIFEDDDSYVPSSQGDEVDPEEGSRRQLRLYSSDQENEGDVKIYHWTEIRRKGLSGVEETYFSWPVD